jgi:tetratricopeptide (TPR) repeat protein
LPSPAPETPEEVSSFNAEDSRTEVRFYLENGFTDEAKKTVEELERKLPRDPRVAELRALVRSYLGAAAADFFEPEPARTVEPASPAVNATPDSPGLWADLLGPVASALAETSISPAAGSSPIAESKSPSRDTSAELAYLGDLLEEMEDDPATGTPDEDDPETHYQLGVAFREMNLLDEAIGEFQKVVKGAGEKDYPPNFMQACNLLAICFMGKGMAPVAVKWYRRALETPGLDDEVILALQYDLGVAYEQAGDVRSALEKFTEVYGQNIDFRDVAEKIRVSQQKLS